MCPRPGEFVSEDTQKSQMVCSRVTVHHREKPRAPFMSFPESVCARAAGVGGRGDTRLMASKAGGSRPLIQPRSSSDSPGLALPGVKRRKTVVRRSTLANRESPTASSTVSPTPASPACGRTCAQVRLCGCCGQRYPPLRGEPCTAGAKGEQGGREPS